MFDSFVELVRDIYQTDQAIALHEPRFLGNEKNYLLEVIDSGYVSSVGSYVNQFEAKIAEYCGSAYAVATVNGTAALHLALLLAGVKANELVITQAVSFVATSNAIQYCGAEPVFLDVESESLGLSVSALEAFLTEYTERREDGVYHIATGKRIAACLPVHIFGHPCNMIAIMQVCQDYQIPVVEDAAEALGSRLAERHCGSFGLLGVFSFNGNKIITSGGGGMIVTDNPYLAEQAKYLSTTAKQAHPWAFFHDQLGYNYRMPNLNAALGLAQLEQLPKFLRQKRLIAARYNDWAAQHGLTMVKEPKQAQSNYWLNALLLANNDEREQFLALSHQRGILSRPLWTLMPDLPMYQHCQTDALSNSRVFAQCLLNIPSSAR